MGVRFTPFVLFIVLIIWSLFPATLLLCDVYPQFATVNLGGKCVPRLPLGSTHRPHLILSGRGPCNISASSHLESPTSVIDYICLKPWDWLLDDLSSVVEPDSRYSHLSRSILKIGGPS